MTTLLFEEEFFNYENVKKESVINKFLNTSNLEEIKKVIMKDLSMNEYKQDDSVNSDDEENVFNNYKTSYCNKYIYDAIEYGDLNKLKELYEFCKSVDKRFNLSKMEFTRFYNNKHLDVLKWLYEEKRVFKSEIFIKNEGILHLACIAGSLDIIKYVISILEKKKLIKEKYDTPTNVLGRNDHSLEAKLVAYIFKALNNNNVETGLWLYEYLKSKNVVSTYIFDIKCSDYRDKEGTFYYFMNFYSYKSNEYLIEQMKECLPEEEFQNIILKKFQNLCTYDVYDLYPHKRDTLYMDSNMNKQFENNFIDHFFLLYNNLKNKQEAQEIFKKMLFVHGKESKYLNKIYYIAEHYNIEFDWNKLNVNELHHGMCIMRFFEDEKITKSDLIKIMINYIDDVIKENENIFGKSVMGENDNDYYDYYDSENISYFFNRIFFIFNEDMQFRKEMIKKLKEKEYSMNSLLIFFAKYCYMYKTEDCVYVYNILNKILKFDIFCDIIDSIEYIISFCKENHLKYNLVGDFIEFYKHLCLQTNQMEKMFVYKNEKYKNVYYMAITTEKYNTKDNYLIPYLDEEEIKQYEIKIEKEY